MIRELRTDRKIADLRARVARVRELLPASYEAFVDDRTSAEALILNVFLSLQCVSDLALHTVATHGYAVPADARSGPPPIEWTVASQTR